MQWRISEVIDWLLADRRERLAYRHFLHALKFSIKNRFCRHLCLSAFCFVEL